ncbi:hypothetical protein SAMN05421676_107131 [Salinibacillus kushneri]|uniref:Uncharacterized protein n=1 Tax=Salinibacillus kushneri TaxID=237682 RepID=A0A1I0GTD9_9BACI|nr:hypothetical protein [Salinibacillus kushneri]SET73730.1 hypothetical protein SAMN05421676_107131 [Salinibacillus kushneri]
MSVKEKDSNQNQPNISVLTLPEDTKVRPAKYESGFKKADSKTCQDYPAKARSILRKLV